MFFYVLDLLEKNRVIHQGSAERNYHIFYQLLYATTDEELQKLCLVTRKSEEYEFLNKGVASVDKIDDHEEYAATVVGFYQSSYFAWKYTIFFKKNFSTDAFWWSSQNSRGTYLES